MKKKEDIDKWRHRFLKNWNLPQAPISAWMGKIGRRSILDRIFHPGKGRTAPMYIYACSVHTWCRVGGSQRGKAKIWPAAKAAINLDEVHTKKCTAHSDYFAKLSGVRKHFDFDVCQVDKYKFCQPQTPKAQPTHSASKIGLRGTFYTRPMLFYTWLF